MNKRQDSKLKGPGTQTTVGDTTVERLGPFSFVQPSGAHRITTDSVLLAGFASPLGPEDRVVDIGAGSGAIPMMIAANIFATGSSGGERGDNSAANRLTIRMPRVTAVEIDADAAACLAQNVRANGLEAFITPVCADYRDMPARYAPGSFDVVVTNPPYMKAGSSRLSPVASRAAARAEVHGTITDLLDTAEYLLTDHGRFFIVFPVEREDELLEGLSSKGFLSRRITYVHARRGTGARVLMVEAVRDAGGEGATPVVEHIYTGELAGEG